MNLEIIGEHMSKAKNKNKTTTKPPKGFDKYDYYIRSVQSPESDVEFFDKTFKELKGKEALTFREDFCGTHSISCEWIKLNPKKKSVGVDLDPEPIKYGEKFYQAQLNDEQLNRLEIYEANVLDPNLPKADIVSASNFSYYLFKKRKDLLEYFKAAYKNVKKDGIFIVDSFGGSKCQEANEEETEHEDFSYYWDQDSFDPITNEAMFYIHFQPHGQAKVEKCFQYDWRMWTLPEIREVMEEAGFKETLVYWEGSDEDGEGNGEFVQSEQGEECEAWIAYVVGVK